MAKFKAGDKVKYSAQFLKSTGQVSDGGRRGVVTDDPTGMPAGRGFVSVRWNDESAAQPIQESSLMKTSASFKGAFPATTASQRKHVKAYTGDAKEADKLMREIVGGLGDAELGLKALQDVMARGIGTSPGGKKLEAARAGTAKYVDQAQTASFKLEKLAAFMQKASDKQRAKGSFRGAFPTTTASQRKHVKAYTGEAKEADKLMREIVGGLGDAELGLKALKDVMARGIGTSPGGKQLEAARDRTAKYVDQAQTASFKLEKLAAFMQKASDKQRAKGSFRGAFPTTTASQRKHVKAYTGEAKEADKLMREIVGGLGDAELGLKALKDVMARGIGTSPGGKQLEAARDRTAKYVDQAQTASFKLEKLAAFMQKASDKQRAKGSFKGAVPGNLSDNTRPSTLESQKYTVDLLKQGGILPETEMVDDYPVLTAGVKREIIATLLRQKQRKLATWAAHNLVIARHR